MRPPPRPAAALVALQLLLLAINTHGGCEFPTQWQGRWFQSGFGILELNRSSIETKGECVDSQGDKFVVYDRADDCYRCMVIHEKHAAVLQYKETYCDQKATLQDLCYAITGDAPLYSMFRKSPDTRPVACPFKAAPFTFSYNRGSDECSNPPSRAESCTDESRLVLKYQACPDIESTESNVEQLVCVATWKEGSTRYLVGRVSQASRRSATSDEDQYRCFIYERVVAGAGGRVTYHVAQSGDATCNGLQSAQEGSRTMRLTTADTHHGRCRFPNWVTDHHTWLSLDHTRTYKFSLRNATLRITTAAAPAPPNVQANTDRTMPHSHHHHRDSAPATEPSMDGAEAEGEVRVVCHSILQAAEGRRAQIVAHITRGCESGYVCMVFHKRDASVIELQQPGALHEAPDDACRHFDPGAEPYTTLTSPALHSARCPHAGRYQLHTTTGAPGAAHDHDDEGARRRRKRQEQASPPGGPTNHQETDTSVVVQQECLWHDYTSLNIGCGALGGEVMEFQSSCQHQPVSAYTCHGSWQENNTHFLIASPVARRSTDALRYCLVYTFDGEGQGAGGPHAVLGGAAQGSGAQGGAPGSAAGGGAPAQPYSPAPHTVMRLSGLADSCHRFIRPGHTGLWRFNFTTNGGCTHTGDTGRGAHQRPAGAATLLLVVAGALLTSLLGPIR